MTFSIAGTPIGMDKPTYFIADIGANHDGDLERAKMLIQLAKDAGADAAKFQNFSAAKIVSDHGFKAMDDQLSHQAKWKKSVFEVYVDASLPHTWTPALKEECDRVGVDYFSSAYDFEAVDMLDPYVSAFKVGSGDVDWLEMLEHTARKQKPMIIATGAARIGEVQEAIETILPINPQLSVLQCNTNYTGSEENFDHIHLNVVSTYRQLYPDLVIGLSDHTHGHATVLGAVALGARIVEKHFTDDNDRDGPDHPFAMNPVSWREMVDRTRELERALGSSQKFVAGNEAQTVFVQRRCLRARAAIEPGTVLTREHIEVLRPATEDGIRPAHLASAIGMTANRSVAAGEALTWGMLSA